MYRLKQREAKVKADEEARQAALKERIQTLLAEKERQTHKYMRQTRKRDDLGASVVDEDGVDEAGDVSISTHGNTSRHQHQQQIIHTHSDSHAASEDVSIALPLPSDMPPHQSIYSGEDYVDLTTEHIRVNTPDCNNYGGDNDADDDSLDEGSSSLEALQANINNNTNNGNKHMRNNNDTNTTVVNLSSTKVVSMRRLLYPSLSLCFKWSCRSMTSAASDLSNYSRPHTPRHILPITVYTCHTQALIFQLPLQNLPPCLYLTLLLPSYLLVHTLLTPPPPLPQVGGHVLIKGDYQPTSPPPYSLQLLIYTSLLPMYLIHHPVPLVYTLVETKLPHIPAQLLTQIQYNTPHHNHYIHLPTPLQTISHLLPLVIYTQPLS